MTDRKERQSKMPTAQALVLADSVDYGDGAVVSRLLLKNEAGSITLFAFDAGEELSEHSTPYDAFVQVIDGGGEFTVGGKKSTLGAGEIILMPANVPHAVNAPTRFKMPLRMLSAKDAE